MRQQEMISPGRIIFVFHDEYTMVKGDKWDDCNGFWVDERIYWHSFLSDELKPFIGFTDLFRIGCRGFDHYDV